MLTNSQGPVVVKSTKNVGIAILLTFIFGPLGMLYSTIPGAIVMGIISLVVGFLTGGVGLLVTWPICILWAAISAHTHNNRLLGR